MKEASQIRNVKEAAVVEISTNYCKRKNINPLKPVVILWVVFKPRLYISTKFQGCCLEIIALCVV